MSCYIRRSQDGLFPVGWNHILDYENTLISNRAKFDSITSAVMACQRSSSWGLLTCVGPTGKVCVWVCVWMWAHKFARDTQSFQEPLSHHPSSPNLTLSVLCQSKSPKLFGFTRALPVLKRACLGTSQLHSSQASPNYQKKNLTVSSLHTNMAEIKRRFAQDSVQTGR